MTAMTTIVLTNSSLLSVILFISMLVLTGLVCAIVLFVSMNPSERIIKKSFQNYNTTFFFFYQKATAYRLLFNAHTFISTALKISNACTTFIVVYCAMVDESYILLFSMLSALGNVIALTIPFEGYAKMYVEASRELERALLDDNATQQTLLNAYNRAEEIIQNKFM